jgi:hypothetical protein
MGIDRFARVIAFGDLAFHPGRGAGRRDQIVFELRDAIAHHLQRIARIGVAALLAIEALRLHDALDEAAAVVGVDNVEIRP